MDVEFGHVMQESLPRSPSVHVNRIKRARVGIQRFERGYRREEALSFDLRVAEARLSFGVTGCVSLSQGAYWVLQDRQHPITNGFAVKFHNDTHKIFFKNNFYYI